MNKLLSSKIPILLLFLTISASLGALFLGTRTYPINSKITPTPLPSPQPSPTPPPKSQLSAWIAQWDQDQALVNLDTVKNNLSSISPVWYSITQNGRIIEMPNLTSKPQITKLAHTANLSLLPTIVNEFDHKRVSTLLKNKPLQVSQIDKLVKIATQSGFSGYDLDWEQISQSDRDNFTNFVTLFSQKLHQNNLILSVTVHAQNGLPDDWEGTKGQDYPTLGAQADLIRIMAYDYHYEDSSPGPITPLEKLEEALKYAKTTLPADKIVLGLPTYGYDWTPTKGEGLQYQEIIDRLASLNASSYRDDTSFELRSDYTQKGIDHHVWYVDKDAILKKIDLARSYGVYQFCFWRLGGEDPDIWDALN